METCTRKVGGSRVRAKDGLFEVVSPDAAGIDVGASEMWVCVPEGRGPERVRKFGTATVELEALSSWLLQCGVKTVAMESTGVYWIPLFQILENHGLEACLVNARHVKNVPGRRKTDQLDCRWLQKLHACGLLASSFRPSPEICRVRACLRQRAVLIREQARYTQRMQKALREMNVLLDQAVSDVTGSSGMRILEAILAGQQSPEKLAELADPRVKKSREQIARYLQGDYRSEHLFVLRQALEAHRFFHEQIRECDRQVEAFTAELVSTQGATETTPPAGAERAKRTRGTAPAYDVRTLLYRLTGVDLTRIPGIAETSAQALVSETGLDMTRWPTAKHFVSWLDLCPSPKVSGGRIIAPGRRHAANRATQLFRQAASSLTNSACWLGVFYRRMRLRLGGTAAVKATAHKLATIYYRVMSTRTAYRELPADRYQERFRQRALHNLRRRALQFGMVLAPCDASGTDAGN
jgi:transposase